MNGGAPLKAEIRRLIGIAGPMPVAEYMSLCLTHPQHGYYMSRDPLGVAGDFTTAPEISQIFGELIGIWAGSVWQQMGSPDGLQLIELGPGRGTMMRDMLRAARVVPGFRQAIAAHLVEISPTLERRQRRTLHAVDVPLLWHKTLDEVPEGPAIIVANEFFDALPIHQAVKADDGWHERMIGVESDGSFGFVIGAAPLPRFGGTLPQALRDAPSGSVFEWRPHQPVLAIARRLVRDGGAALVIDYGHAHSACGETLQAVAQHAYANPLQSPGLVDLTAHVDFQALAVAAESMGARALGPIAQGDFLLRLGLKRRAAVLKAKATADQAASIEAAVERLTAEGPDGMGRLFKAFAIAQPSLGPLPGFET